MEGNISPPGSSMRLSVLQLSREILCTTWVATFFAVFVYAYWEQLILDKSIVAVLFLVKTSLDFIFTVARRFPRTLSLSPLAWGAALGRMVINFMFRPAPALFPQFIGGTLLGTGLVLQILALFSLGRSFGIVAANRGIITGGLYRFVRHPLYASYCLSHIGYTLASTSLTNVLVCLLSIALMVLSIREEEGHLQGDSAYQDYCQTIKWRLFPGLY